MKVIEPIFGSWEINLTFNPPIQQMRVINFGKIQVDDDF